jgi:hypothetical protein
MRHNETRGQIRLAIDGSTFSYIPGNAESRRQALAKAEAHYKKVEAAIQEHAEKTTGRRLTEAELLRGVTPTEDRSRERQMADRTAETVSAMPKFDHGDTENPFRNPALTRRQRETPEQARERLAAQWDARKAAENEAAKQPSQQRQRAIDLAEKAAVASRFDPAATVTERQRIERMKELAESGDLADFRVLHKEHQDTRRARVAERQATFDEQIAALRTERAGIDADEFELPEVDEDAPTPVARNLWELHLSQ